MKLIYTTVACFVVLLAIGASCGEDDAAKTDKNKLPENPTAKSLVEFVKKLQQAQPANQQDADANETRIKAACEKILELEKGDTTPDGRFAKRLLLVNAIQAAGDPNSPAWKKSFDELLTFSTQPNFSIEDVELASELGQVLEQSDPKRALEFYTTASKLFATSKDPAIVEAAKPMAGTMRRVNLVGHEMELKGTTVDGKAFDVASLKGKVVLVDFWATWCRYCVEEIPNVKRNYMGYHGKGFEVVAISADQDRAALDGFLQQNKIPWINVHDEGGKNPALAYYNIPGFPTTFLIGKDGKVVSMNARGKKLDEELQKQLGDPDPIKVLPKAEAPKAAPLQNVIEDAIKDEK